MAGVSGNITATELARNLSSAIDTVRTSGKALLVTKGGKPAATLAPPPKSGLDMGSLIEVLGNLPELGGDAASFADDVRKSRRNSNLPGSSWD